MERFRFANKPGVVPGKPINLDATGVEGINAHRINARIEAGQHGVWLSFSRMAKRDARLVIKACENGAIEKGGRFEQHGKTVSFKIGGAF